MPGPEKPLEHLLRVATLPPPGAAPLEVRRPERPLVPDAVEDYHRLGATFTRKDSQALIAGGPRVRPFHAPPEERVERERQE